MSDVSRFLCVVWVKTPVLECSCAAVSPTCVRLLCVMCRDSHVWYECQTPMCVVNEDFCVRMLLCCFISHMYCQTTMCTVCVKTSDSNVCCECWTPMRTVNVGTLMCAVNIRLPFVLWASWLQTALWVPRCVRPDSCVCFKFKSSVRLRCIL